MEDITVGVLALQGDFREHLQAFRKIETAARDIRLPGELDQVQGLVIPGGESTTINKLIDKYDFQKKLHDFAASGRPVFGTCAGLILLSKKAVGEGRQLGFIDIEVERNAYGRQIESFEEVINLDLGNGTDKKRFNAVFIRAPKISRTGSGVKVLGTAGDEVVLARENNILVCAFHPELTDDNIIHKYFLEMIREYLKEK